MQNASEKMLNSDRKSPWATKLQSAGHFGVCRRTIDAWLARGVLVYLKVRNVVRIHIPRSEERLAEYRLIV